MVVAVYILFTYHALFLLSFVFLTVARLKDIFGNYVDEYFAPDDGVVIGKSSNPVAEKGSKILHLGLNTIDKSIEEEMETLRQ